MSDTCSQLGLFSSKHDDLQRSLANRLRVLMDGAGSDLYAHRWTTWGIGLPPPICALRASARRTSGNGCGGWLTPKTPTGGGSPDRTTPGGGNRKLEDQVEYMMTGWATPKVGDVNESRQSPEGILNTRGASTYTSLSLDVARTAAGWPTATTADAVGARNASSSRKPGSKHSEGTTLTDAAWSTRGPISPGSSVPTDEQGRSLRLNPKFSGWLQGYPLVWDSLAPDGKPRPAQGTRDGATSS